MNILSLLLTNIIIMLCPLLLYLFYCIYNVNIDRKQNQTFLDFAILSSLYLLITNYKFNNNSHFIILLNIPLIIAMFKKRTFISIIISLIIISIYHILGINVIYMIIQYAIHYFIYLIYQRKKINFNNFLLLFIFVKAIFLITGYFIDNKFGFANLTNIVLILILFSLISYLIVYLFKKCEAIVNLHMNIKTMQKEKQFRDSLFKITHEIKNPIAVCKSYLDMYDENNKDHKRYIPIVKEEIQKILFLLQDFLSMNKIKITKELLDINLLLEEIISQFSPVLDDEGIIFKYDISQDEVYIDGDYNRLNQVLVNIIKNSIEAVDKNKNHIFY